MRLLLPVWILLLHMWPMAAMAQDDDYTSFDLWWAHPEKSDFADHVPGGPFEDRQDTAMADVFYLHPTTFYRGFSTNATLHNASVERLTNVVVLNQATVFNGSCRVFAPKYRQTILKEFMLKNDTSRVAAFNIAYADVKNAFETYLKTWNNGRPIVIAGHSQGSYLAQRLLADYFEGKPLFDKLVVAYIPGYPLLKEAFDDQFRQIRFSQKPDDIGCIVAWQTVHKKTIEKQTDQLDGRLLLYHNGGHRFIQSGDSLACTNPLSWYTDSIPIPYNYNPGSLVAVTRPGHMPIPQKAICDATVKEGKVAISHLRDQAFNSTGGNYHIHDYGLFWVSIRENVDLRVRRYLEMR